MSHPEEGNVKKYLAKYHNQDITRRDVVGTLMHYQGLAPKLASFVFNDGRKMELFNLQGTIPVSYKVFSSGLVKQLLNLSGTIPVPYRGNVYNIPICIWLMDTHPYNAPMCYVKPTSDMQIKVSRFVDHNGKIYLPYLHDWVPNSSDLLGLIQVMIVTFGDMPPVYAKQRTDMPPSTPYPTQPYMPMPGGSGGSNSSPYPPPYPTSSTYQSPALPNQYPFSPYYPAPHPNFPAAHSNFVSPGYPYQPSNTHNFVSYPPSYSGPTQTVSPPSTNTANNSTGTTGTITEEHIKASLLSAVEDKLRRRLREQFSQTQAELDTLGRTQQELTQGKNKLDDILLRLEKEQVELDKNITILKDKEQELEKAIERLSEQQPIDVDEAVTTTAPLYKQLLNAFAEEAATEDAIYYMGEALRRGVIDLDVFLKQVRSLSRKQFMLRALMHKCRQKAGLAGHKHLSRNILDQGA